MKPFLQQRLTLIAEIMLGVGCAIALSALRAHAQGPAPTGRVEMDLFQSLILGVIQGLTEFIPISSTAHLKVIPEVLGWGDPGVTFTAVIQLGSIAAVLWYFWGDIVDLSLGAWRALQKRDWQDQNWRISLGIAVGTVPIVLVGLLLKALVPDLDNSPIRSLGAIALASIVMASLLALGEKIGKRTQTFENLKTRDGIIMGLAQALALMPGVSRSGSTITAGLFMGLERATAARFSFLLGIPAITLAGLVQLKTDVIDVGVSQSEWISLIAGTASSAVFSYLSIAWLLKYLQKQNTWVFVWYRLGFGVVILAGLALGWLV
ncbi:undecaprenyl-diphosphate phosphatase [Spirulina sp. CCNP1310]|uniref:undecaprenyl-diphosphate phosphatase n=1 Tax=Spirulina sp. CCNP1310 TaxID=3110249 RepID=UPI002B206888|nr:undecaprenyl-diphosphate phosphatase [Spirulina sp. CCNP1310]MEA5418058.1 undecaprenyl-diphosphate phosphatase [Spirulina sp. CCNP1310]